ncbi:MAG TPA: YqiA/YcfP family alpha/beta fold hydrolase [Myxococcales bacterium]|nr:YqiA/YcfP family alpha/beta fold hydrolase [Myxococcales bacterium]
MRFAWLHGFASGPTSSKGQFVRARLRDRGADLLLPDLNEPSFFELTVTRMLSQLDALLQGIEPVVLFGSSLGGFTAATWAAGNPGRMAALVLLAPAFDLGPRWERQMGADAARWRAAGRFAFDHYARGGRQDLSIGFLDDAYRYESFPLPRCPTLVVQGTRDEVVDPSLAREFTRRMDGRAQLVELPEGHELNADLPALWKRIEPFLDAYAPRPTP